MHEHIRHRTNLNVIHNPTTVFQDSIYIELKHIMSFFRHNIPQHGLYPICQGFFRKCRHIGNSCNVWTIFKTKCTLQGALTKNALSRDA
jgi:hypothetical protein